MKFTFLTLIALTALSPTLFAQSGSTGGGQNQDQPKIKWTVDPFEHDLFVENKGQFDTVDAGGKVLFESQLGAADAFFTAKGILYRHIETDKLDFDKDNDPDASGPPQRHFYYLKTEWEGANPNPTIVADMEQSYYYTYPKGTHDTYIANVFKKITYQNLYPGIDVVYTFPDSGKNLEYTIIVHPGGDLSKVHLKYQTPGSMQVDGAGNLIVKNDIGTLQESAPVSYYAEGHQSVSVTLQVNGQEESFVATGLDGTKTLMIDPAITWTTNPGFTVAPDYAYDLDYDNQGNVYVYGGGVYPFQLVKLNAGGAIQWAFNATLMTSTSNFYGDFATDKHSQESYIVEGWNSIGGAGSRIEKVSPAGILMATDPGSPLMNEMWRIQSTVCPAGFLIFGNGNAAPDQAAMLDTTMAGVTPANILGAAVTTANHDMCFIASDPLGGTGYTATTLSLNFPAVDPDNFVSVPIPALTPNNYVVPDKFAFKELLSIAYGGGAQYNAMNGMACGLNFLYAYNGDTLKQINKATGAIIKSVKVSNTAYTWGGLDVDLCGNVYAANDEVVEIYSPTLGLTGALPPLSGITYDFKLAPYITQLAYACGQGFVSELSLGAPITNYITIQKGGTTCAPCSGVAKATLNICGNPDSTNVTYRWSDGETTRTAKTLCAGVDTVTISIGCAIIFKDTVTIRIVGSIITLSTTQVNATCNTLGSATVTPAGGSAPYTYAWTPTAQTNATATGLSAGTYTITVTDKNTCTASTTVTITQPSIVTVITANTNEKCNGGATATATATAAGGTAPYTYKWTPGGQTTASATDLSAGTYTITVTDNNGCTATSTVTIGQPPLLTATIGAPTNVLCNGGANGSAKVTAGGGTAPYTYLWNPSAQTNATATGLSAGTYTATVTDKNGCTATASVTITQPPLLTATMGVPTNVLCNGTSTGSATVTGGGGTPGYTYNWTPNGGVGATGTGLSAGTYTATVKDANGCTATASVTITQPPLLTATMGAPTNVSCNGGTNGSATVTAGGGKPGYSYAWTPIGGTGATGTGFSAGTYTVTVTDANGCTATAPVTITQPAGMVLTTSSTQSTCGNNNGTATVTVAGGNPAYTYSWNPSAQTTPTATGLGLGTYTITVTDANGCSQTATAIVTSPNNLTATITASTNILCNGAATGSATVTAAGGIAPYTYLWTPSAQTTPTANGLTAATYTATVTDNTGCSVNAIVTITQPPLLTATMGAPANILCNGGTGSATVTAGGGTPGYTYNWTPNGGAGATGTGLSAGTYTATVTDANGCTATASVTITQPAILTATINASANILCNGGATGSASVTAAGGTPAYNYAWTPSGGNTTTANGLTANTYTITVTDANGCTASSSVTLTQPTAITLTTSATQSTCGNNNGTTTVVAAGGTPGYKYLWNPSANTNATATGLGVGTYTVTVTDANGCTQTSTASVTSPNNLSATITASTNLLCNGAATGSATVTGAGGTAPYTYLWTPSAQTTPTANGLSAGTYTATVTDNTGCSVNAIVTITQPPLLTATIGAPANVLCNGGADGSANVTAGGGTPGYTYNWTPNGGVGATGTGLSAGTYTATVTDANGCTATASVTITQPAILTATISASTNVLCNGGATGSATVTAGGGTPGYTYAWTPSGGNTTTANGLTANTYTITVTDANGCTATSSVTLTQPTAITLTTSATQSTCGNNNGTATVVAAGGTPGYKYLWNPSANTNATATGLSVGVYTITVTDANGCTQTSIANVTTPSNLSATITASTNVLCNGASTGSATVTAAGGLAPYTYAWNPSAQTNPTATALSAGTYTATVTDNTGCSVIATITITQPPLLTATMAVPTNVLCNGGADGSANVTAGGGTPGYTYNWTPIGGTGATGTGFSAGTYTVTVTDANGCTATAPVTITQPTALTANISATVNVSCSGGNNGSLAVTVAGGSPAYTYAWTPAGGNAAIASGLSAGAYSVTVTDANGCTATATGTVTEPAILTAAISNTVNVTCFGLSNGTLTVTPAGGSPVYTYSWKPTGGTAATASNLGAGTYTVTVTDANGCTATTSGTITEPTVLTVTASGPGTICSGSTATLNSNPSGGTLPYTYAWTPVGGNAQTANVVVTSTTTYTVTVTDNNGCTATSSVTVTAGPPLTAVVSGAASFCPGGSATLTAFVTGGSNYTFLWIPGNYVTQSITVSPTSTTTYTVEITDACGGSVSVPVTVTVNPIPSTKFEAIPAAGCAPMCILFHNLTTISSGSISSWVWNSGNNQTSNSKNPIFCYSNPGSYSVSLTATSDSGCSSTLNVSNVVTIYPHPDASFTWSPQPVDMLTPTVQFTSTASGSADIVYWNWKFFGDGTDSSSNMANPTHTYSDTGTYCATLTVMDQHGCIDSATNCLVVEPLFTFYIPDAFSPNGDGINDVFMPKGSYIKDYEMYIFDRWGEKLFHTNNINIGWNGTVGGGSTVCQEDVYVYLINVTDSKGTQHSYTGKVNLVK